MTESDLVIIEQISDKIYNIRDIKLGWNHKIKQGCLRKMPGKTNF